MNFSIFYHIATLSNWRQSHDIIQQHLNNSGILDKCKQIYYCVNGDIDEVLSYLTVTDHQVNTVLHLENTYTKFEFPTINTLHHHLMNNDSKALYIHTKGASQTHDPGFIKYWLDTMAYHNICRFTECLELLNSYDVVGTGYTTHPWPHFSGNFWWTHTSHINKLSILRNNYENFPHCERFGERHDAERWICSTPGNFFNLGNHYHNSIYKPLFDEWESKQPWMQVK
jgi:hypothetical protein